jgi:imidazolonepropionase-like amidohydrolase
MYKIYFAIIFCFFITPSFAQNQFLLEGGKYHIGNGSTLENAFLLISEGKISYIGTQRPAIDASTQVISCAGKQIYPGFIALGSTVGLVEIEAVRATVDNREVGIFNPNVRSLVAFDAESQIIPTIRSNGILMAQSIPSGGVIPGTSSVFNMDGWNWEDAVFQEDIAIHLNWPERVMFTGWWAEPGGIQKNEQYLKQVAEIKVFFDQAAAYRQNKQIIEKNLKLESMKALWTGSKRLYIHANLGNAMMDAITFAESYGITPVIVGGKESWIIADFLAEKKIDVILRATHELPSRQDEAIDQPFRTPSVLHAKGVRFALSMEGAWKQRNLPFQAGQAIGFGLPYDAALSSITGNAAAIAGIGDRVGTLEKGKTATLFVSEGDALDMLGNQVIRAFIDGRDIDLDNKHKALYRKYKAKYDAEK